MAEYATTVKLVLLHLALVFIAMSVKADEFQTLEQQAERELSQAVSLRNRIKKTLMILENERDSLSSKGEQIPDIVARNPDVIKINKMLESHPLREVKQRCHPLFDQHLKVFTQGIKQNFTQTMNISIDLIKSNLIRRDKDLAIIEDILNDHLGDELESCRTTESSCRIRNEFKGEIMSELDYVSNMESFAPTLGNSLLTAFENVVVPYRIDPDLLDDAYRCEKERDGILDNILAKVRDSLGSVGKFFE